MRSANRQANDALAVPDANPEPASLRVRHLLAVARAEFVAHGFDAVSIDSIARAASVSKETIYRHFADKEALFRAALDAAGAEFAARAAAVHEVAGAPAAELSELARAILDSALDQGLFSALWIAAGVARRMPDLAANLIQGQWQGMEPVRLALEGYARERGVTGTVPLELALDFGSLAVEGPAVLMGMRPPVQERGRIARRVAVLFAEGIAGVVRHGGDQSGQALAAPAAAAPPPGEPRDKAVPPHIRTLLTVAGQHFLDLGFENANLDVIGAEARVGRGTLYRHFGSKAGLFAATMRHLARQCLPDAAPVLAMPAAATEDDRAALVDYVELALASLASVESIQLHRVVISQSRRDPELSREIFTMLRAPWVTGLRPWLEAIGLRDDADWYARQLLVLGLRGNRVFSGRQPVSAEDRRAYARRAVAIFLGGFISLV